MAIKIRKDGVVQDLVINANEVRVLDKDGNFRSKNLETVLKELNMNGGSGGGTGTGGSGYPKDAEYVYVKDSEPDMDGVWFDESDVSSQPIVGDNSVVKAIREYIDTDVKKTVLKNEEKVNQMKELVDNSVGVVPELVKPNLLTNGDFKVNQRASSTYTTTGKAIYTVDRWISYNLTDDTTEISVLNKGIKVKSISGGHGRLRQTLEETDTKRLIGKTLTFSIKVLSDCSQCSLITTKSRNVSGASKVYTNVKAGDIISLTFDVTSDYAQLGVQFSSNDTNGISVEYAKLEIGSISTPFTSKPYSQELADCQRYCQIIKNVQYTNIAYAICQSSSGTCASSMKLITPMRTVPTLAQYPDIVENHTLRGSSTGGIQGTINLSPYCSQYSVNITFTPSSSVNMTVGSFGLLQFSAKSNKDIIFDAEIY